MSHLGLLPFALPAAVVLALRLGALAVPAGGAPQNASDRAVAGGLLAAALIVVGTRLLGALDLLFPRVLAAALLVCTAAALVVRRDQRFVFPWREMADRTTVPLLAVAAGALLVTVAAAVLLPVWQWDALGYHLPYVDFALQVHGTRGIPRDMPYISTYPHNAELLFVALRAMLPDDRLVDLGQIPLGILGAVATAGIARRLGASRPLAVAAGAAWLVVPAVFLQLPTDYIDVAAAAFLLAALHFVLAPPTTRSVLLAGTALGLFLGTKPNAPLGTVLVGVVLLVQGQRARLLPMTLVALLVAFVLGGEAYVTNLHRHGNPVWPVEMNLGPLHLAGTEKLSLVMGAGAAAPRLHGPLPLRLLRSWLALDSAPTFDMRIGGYGPLFLVALIPLGWLLARRRDLRLAVLTLATLAAPDPPVARYVLAFPALALAASAALLASALGTSNTSHATLTTLLRWTPLAAAALALWQVRYAYPGLAGDGPPLIDYVRMSDRERVLAVGAVGSPEPILDATARVKEGESFAFDKTFELGHLAWPADLGGRASWVPQGLSPDDFVDLVHRENAAIVAVGDDTAGGAWLKQHPEQYLPLFSCRAMPCTLYARR
jgi:hypothetical protein